MDGILLLTVAAALAQPADPPSAPDSHDLRRERGDVLVVDGRPPAAPPDVPENGRPAARCPAGGSSRVGPEQRPAPPFFESGHVIADPAQFALPLPEPGRRWIRCGEDAVLVELRSGRAIRVEVARFR